MGFRVWLTYFSGLEIPPVSGDHNVHQSRVCERCLKHVSDHGVHTCTPTKGWRELEKQRDELLAALKFARDKIASLHIELGDGECHYPILDYAEAFAKAKGD